MSERLAFFGHHPDPSTDFCIEIDVLEGWAYDIIVGNTVWVSGDWRATSPKRFWGHLSRALRWARQFESTLDEIATNALPALRGMAGRVLTDGRT